MKKPCSHCPLSKEAFDRRLGRVPNSVHCADCEKYDKYKQFRESRRKYKPGKVISSMKEFEEHINDSCLYMHDKPKPIAFLISLQYRVLSSLIRYGKIRIAVKKQEG